MVGGLHEGRPAVHTVLLVHVCVLLHQQLYQGQLPCDSRQHQWGRPVPVDQVHVVRVFIGDLLDQLKVSYKQQESR